MNIKKEMACWSVKNVLDLYIDTRLTSNAKNRVKAHLSSCRSCREAAAAMAPVKIAKRTIAPPPGLTAAIAKQAVRLPGESRGPGTTSWIPAFAGMTAHWHLTPAQAAAFVYLAILTAGNMFPGPSHQGPPQRIESELE